MSDFGPKITIKIVENLREDILSGKLKSGSEIKVCMNSTLIMELGRNCVFALTADIIDFDLIWEN